MTRTGYALATMLTAGSFTGLFVAVTVVGPTPRFLWNASASAPIGLYRLHRSDPPVIGQLVAALPPAHLGRWMAERHSAARRAAAEACRGRAGTAHMPHRPRDQYRRTSGCPRPLA